MSTATPHYFYIAHLHVAHPLSLVKVVDTLKIFKEPHPDCQILYSVSVRNFVTLTVSTESKINPQAIDDFEKKATRLEGVGIIFTHSTNTATKDQKVVQDFPPTFVYSGCYGLAFSRWDYWFGRVKCLENKLEKILCSIDGGAYYLLVRRTYMALILESPTPLKKVEVDSLFGFLQEKVSPPLTSFSNLSTF